MRIKIFKEYEEANTFADTVKVSAMEYHDGTIVVFYKPYLTKEEAKALKILEDKSIAEVGLQQAEMHLDYLLEVKKSGSTKVESGIENTKENIINHKASLEAIKKWEND